MSAEDHDLLLEIKGDLKALVETFESVSKGDGFARCVQRGERVKRLEQDVIELKVAQKAWDADSKALATLTKSVDKALAKKEAFDVWLMRSTWVIIIAGVVKFSFFK